MLGSSSQKKARPPPIRIVRYNKFHAGRAVDNSSSTSAHATFQELVHLSGFSTDNHPPTPVSAVSLRTLKSSWGSNPGTPSQPRFLLERSPRTASETYSSDEDYPLLTPLATSDTDHVRIASGRSDTESDTLLHVPRSPYKPKPLTCQSPVYSLGFDLALPTPSPLRSHFGHPTPPHTHCAETGLPSPVYSLGVHLDLPSPSPNTAPVQPPLSPNRFTLPDGSVNFSAEAAEVWRLPAPIEQTSLGTPDFTDPFANNRPLKRLPRISQKEFKPLAKRVIKSFSRERSRARVGSDENKPDISVSRRPTKVAKRQKFFAAKPLVMTPNQNKAPAESFLDLSPHETSGMSSAEQRMLRLMKVLFSDVEYAEVQRERDESELPARPTCVPRRKTDGSILSTDTTPSETITV